MVEENPGKHEERVANARVRGTLALMMLNVNTTGMMIGLKHTQPYTR